MIQKTPFKVRVLPAIFAYILLGVALTICLFQIDTKKAWWHSTIQGALCGFIIYGVYNATNMAIFSQYQTSVAIIDTVWGTTLFAVTVTIAFFLRKHFRRMWDNNI